MTLSRNFLLARGHCCGLGCKNCPYTKPVKAGNTELELVRDSKTDKNNERNNKKG